MKITILAIGSLGDVQPLVVLGAGLKDVGYQINFATHYNFRDLVINAGLDFSLIPVNPQEVLESEEGRKALEQTRRSLASIRAFAQMTYPYLFSCGCGCWEACQGTEAIISSTLGAYFSSHIQEKIDVPVINVFLQPRHQTGDFPSPFYFSWTKKSPFYNRLTWRIFDFLLWYPQKKGIDTWRRNILGLPSLSSFKIFDNISTDQKNPYLYGFSPSVVPKPHDWGDNIKITGFFFQRPQNNWSPSEKLTEFLNNGPKPIYVGFGSMSSRSSRETTQIIIKAFKQTKQRGLFAKGWGGIEDVDLPENIFLIDWAPHDWLFPRMAAVMHHCGAGTTASGLVANVPTIPIPFFADQPFWAKRLYELGAATKPILHEEINVDKLVEAIHTAVHDTSLKKHASILGEKIRTENGIRNAVEAIKNILNHAADKGR